MKYGYFFLLFLWGLVPLAFANDIDIAANEGIEWDREAKRYTARGAVVLRQNDMDLGAEELIIHYEEVVESGETKTKLLRIDATDDVTIANTAFLAQGDRGVYDVVNGLATLVGSNLQLSNFEGLLVRARDTLEYWDTRNELIARGDAELFNEGNQLRADVILAKLTRYQDTQQEEISELQAQGSIKVNTAEHTITGDRARYDSHSKLATICGGVSISANGQEITGECAEANLGSGYVRIIAGQTGGRVRAVITPLQ
ncbi:MAG: LptA/OstA family protein [Pseudomonadota bacterium]